MITVNKRVFKEMMDAGVIKFGKYDKNFTTINRKKKSRRHKYAVVETKEVKTFFRKKSTSQRGIRVNEICCIRY